MLGLVRKLNLSATIITAVDGTRLTSEDRARYNSRSARRVYGCDMTDSEIACYLSHLSIYRLMLEKQIPVALILEDDISCAEDLRSIVDNLVSQTNGNWQVLRLQSTKRSVAEPSSERTTGQSVAKVGSHEIYRLRTSVLGGCAYLIRLQAAASMLARSRRINMPIDQTLDRYWENGIIPYVVRPMPVWHEDKFGSEIGARGRAIGPTPSLSLLMGRRVQRLIDAANKRIFWIAFRIPSLGSMLARLGVGSARAALNALWCEPMDHASAGEA